VQIVFRRLIDDPSIVAAPPAFDDLEGEILDPREIASAKGRYEGLLDRWCVLFGLSRSDLSPEADPEDWIENAVRLVAAVDTGLPVHVISRPKDGELIPLSVSFNASRPFDPQSPSIFCGTPLRWDPLFRASVSGDPSDAPLNLVWPGEGRLGQGTDYWNEPVLMRALNRKAAVSSGNPDGEKGYVAVTRELIGKGADRLLAKIIFQSKYQHPTDLDIRPGADGRPLCDKKAIDRAFYEAFEYSLMDCDGRESCFLIQERRNLLHEYRIVVVDGEPVAGAGTVEWLCPVFHDPGNGTFDMAVEGKRNDRNLVKRPGVVSLFRAQAEDICREIERTCILEGRHNGFRNCTMDFALDADTGEAVLVETNPLDHFGLYAMDYAPVMQATVAAARKDHEAKAERLPEPTP